MDRTTYLVWRVFGAFLPVYAMDTSILQICHLMNFWKWKIWQLSKSDSAWFYDSSSSSFLFISREIGKIFNRTANSAENGNDADQLACYGMRNILFQREKHFYSSIQSLFSEYPTNCTSYYGLHDVTCLETIWLSTLCLLNGTGFPPKLDQLELNKYANMNLR